MKCTNFNMKSLVMLLFTINCKYGEVIIVLDVPMEFRIAGEIKCVSAEFPELKIIPKVQIFLINASRSQSSATAVNPLCNC